MLGGNSGIEEQREELKRPRISHSVCGWNYRGGCASKTKRSQGAVGNVPPSAGVGVGRKHARFRDRNV